MWSCRLVKKEQRCKNMSANIKMTPRESECEEEKNSNKNSTFLLGEGWG